ncbi:GSU2403 family nucleotidyltransferase fold protein [Pseudodesulfovibrio pelocollis]|uniref:GSU2403 family nucleotidyltransferase fold protein n=1 Tax=Pseudodesulfovibrio pelocollis TaxID=3051432 RepID=UPI00255AAA08|nr:GSU2403 family nucleotidyltransferase fold protein [Pseudodesulfovibrio sp. SB368]
MKRLPIITHSLYAELVDQCRAEPRDPGLWPLSGSIVTVPVDGQEHWYFQMSRRTTPVKYQQREYIGPVGDARVAERVAAFESAKAGYANRAEIISTLKSAGVTAPTGKVANLLLGLHEAGTLEKAILVGTIAFQAYGAMLGAKFGQAAFYTQDVDMTQADSISLAVTEETSSPPLLDVLKSLDPTFDAVPGLDPRTPPVSYINKDKIRLDVLMPFSGPPRGPIPARKLKTHGHPQRFLDYLIADPVETVLLVGGGALTHTPAPARFALHKLIISQRRSAVETAKKRKDLLQAEQLLILLMQDAPDSLAEAHQDLKGRGPKWNALFEAGLASLDKAGVRDSALELFGLRR